MLAEERRSTIRELLVHKPVVTLAELSVMFDASEMTVRRDLDALAEQGVCQRIRGGAISLRPPDNRSFAYPPYFSRRQSYAREKAAIAQAAAALVQPGDTIALDSGTTMTMLAEALGSHEGITVISNSLQVLNGIRLGAGIVAISPGGIMTMEDMGAGEMSFAGPMTVSALRAFRPRRSFISASGVVMGEGIFNAGLFQAEIKRTLIEIGGEAVLATDSSKFGHANGVLVAPLTRFRTVITDTGAPPEVVAALRRAGTEVILVEPLSDGAPEDGRERAGVAPLQSAG